LAKRFQLQGGLDVRPARPNSLTRGSAYGPR